MGQQASKAANGETIPASEVAPHVDIGERSIRNSELPSTSAVLAQNVSGVHIGRGSLNLAGRDNVIINNHFPPPTGLAEILDAFQLQEVAAWLSPINFRDILGANLDKRTPQTGIWFTEGLELDRWLTLDGGVLWCTGMPGAGKTMLSSIAVDYFQRQAEANPGKMSISFAFCRYTEPLSVTEILAALVRQNLENHPSLLSEVQPLYIKHRSKGTKPSQGELIQVLTRFTTRFEINIYSLDGLDEAMDEAQFSLLDIFSTMNVHFLITSRPLQRLQSVFPKAHRLDITVHDEDIALYVADRIRSSPRLRTLLDSDLVLKSKVTKEVTRKSGGMFLHALLQMDVLRQCLTVAEIEEAIDMFPAGLDAMYSATLRRIEQQGPRISTAARNFLAWVVLSRGPMKMTVVQDALATCIETGVIDPKRRIAEEDLIPLSCGLVVIESETQTLRLVHYTAREALQSWMYVEGHSLHRVLALTCISRLSACGFQNLHIADRAELDKYVPLGSLLQYAYCNWAHHTRQCTDPETLKRVEAFIVGCTSYPVEYATSGRRPLPADRYNGVHLSAYLGFASILRKLLDSDSQLCNQRSGGGLSPLALACLGGKADAVLEILSTPGLDMSRDNAGNHTPLQLAISSGSEDIVQALLGHPEVDVNATGGSDDYTPLMSASAHGLEGIVRILLGHPMVNLAAKNRNGSDAVKVAVERGHAEIVQLLVDHPVVQNMYTSNFRTTMVEAAEFVRGRHRSMERFVADSIPPIGDKPNGPTYYLQSMYTGM
ncbi:hypothetical protein BKA70DRAFT_94920 [Coprinopsis sp. MPI-PUGE-AT-0042]|nr:hypothetical protein BKA70DRAFT_94920 [Coprinopsis sp. MPI-PUGE-AT-0042]